MLELQACATTPGFPLLTDCVCVFSLVFVFCLVYLHLRVVNPHMVAHFCNPSSQKAEAGGLPRFQGQPELYKNTVSQKRRVIRLCQMCVCMYGKYLHSLWLAFLVY